MKPNNKEINENKRLLYKRKLPMALIAGFLLLVGLFSINKPASDVGALLNVAESLPSVEEKGEKRTPSVKPANKIERGGYEGQPLPDKPDFTLTLAVMTQVVTEVAGPHIKQSVKQ